MIPSGLVITRFPVPLFDTATNKDNLPAQQMLVHWLSTGVVRVVHVIPSGLVIARLPVPDDATAAYSDSSGAHATAVHEFAAAALRTVQELTVDEINPELGLLLSYKLLMLTPPHVMAFALKP